MLLQAIRDLEAGLCATNLGSGLFKVRMARKGQGKSGGYRTLIVYRQDNIANDELVFFKEFATTLLALSARQIDVAIENVELYEIEEEADER